MSALHAADLLLSHGFVQEQAVMLRALDELHEDIMFLVLAKTNDTITELHKQYLESFYQEEFVDLQKPMAPSPNRNMVPRKKIRAYVARLSQSANPSGHVAASATISRTYSGFVHAASPHIMDMYGGEPPHFHLRGMLGTPRFDEHADDAWNYVYRSLLATTAVAKAFGDKSLVESLYSYIPKFEHASGTDFFASGAAGPNTSVKGTRRHSRCAALKKRRSPLR